MVSWTNFPTPTNSSIGGMLTYIDQTSVTGGFFSVAILALVWIITFAATHQKNPKFSLVIAGFFAFTTATLLKVMFTNFSDVYLLTALGSFIAPLLFIALEDRS